MASRNVTPGTTDSSPEHNAVPSATNVERFAEIRARLDAAWRVHRLVIVSLALYAAYLIGLVLWVAL